MTADARRSLCDSEVAKHRSTFSDVWHIGPDELRAMRDAGSVTLVDVRSAAEQEVSTLPGAVPLHELEWPPTSDQPVVVFCTVGFRSSLEARRLAATATPSGGIFSMAGILSWAHSGGELVTPSSGEPVRRLHAYASTWAAMAPSEVEVVVFDENWSWLSWSFAWSVLRLPAVWLLGLVRRTTTSIGVGSREASKSD